MLRAAIAAAALASASVALAAPLVLAALASGCRDDRASPYFGATTRTGKDPSTLYINHANEPEYLDPGKMADTASSLLAVNLFEGLTTYDPKDIHPTQGMATSWEQSDDNRVYRFHLRDDGRWSDGKPVTAHDFEYAWKRVLRPSTAAAAAQNLHMLRNGELFNRGQLLTVRRELDLRATPLPDAPERARLRKGTAVAVVARSPVVMSTGVVPLRELPRDVARVVWTKAEPGTGAPESLRLGTSPTAALAPLGPGWKGTEATVLGRAAAVECNGSPDAWLEIARGGERGYLPGCVLSPAKGARAVLVARHDGLPTYGAAPAPTADPVVPEGFVDEADLETDDAVVGVRATDDRTLEVELERPTPYFLDLTCIPTLAPVRRDVVEAWEARGQPDLWTRPENIVVNGPYTLETWKFRYEITMKPNPHHYARDRLRIRRIVWMEVEEMHAGMNLYKAGEIDYSGDNVALPPEYLEGLERKKDFRRAPWLSTYWYEFNVKKPPLDDARVRRALNLAVDKAQLATAIARGGQIPATHYVPDFTGLGYAEQAAADKAAGKDPFDTPETAHNPERARELLREAGYDVRREGDGWRTSGFPAVEILYNTSEGHRQIAVAIQAMWQRHLGVSANVRNEEWKVLLKNQREGRFQVTRSGWAGDYNHPHTWLSTFLTGNPDNHTGWSDEEFDALVRRAAATADRKESIRLYREAEKRAVAAMPKMPLYFYTKSTLLKPWVKGWYPNPRNVHLVKWFWIDPSWATSTDNEPAVPSLELPPPGRIARDAPAPPLPVP